MHTRTLGIVTLLGMCSVAHAGELNPPGGPIGPTPGPEPRIPINLTYTFGDVDSVYRITAPGSYYLTGNLTGESGKHGIEIEASGVTIDLMGFEFRGVAGSLDGVHVNGVAPLNIVVRNGAVRHWGEDGIDLYTSSTSCSRVEEVQATSNEVFGIIVGSGSTIEGCEAAHNGYGIGAIDHCLITSCVARANQESGIACGTGVKIVDCVAAANTQHGFSTGIGCNLSGCAATSNGMNGFNLSSGCTVAECTATVNVGDGIFAQNDCIILSNTCDSNGEGGDGAGIHLVGSDNRVEGNNCSDNDRGIDIDVGGSIVIRNTCAGNTTANWAIAIGNSLGPIVLAGTNAAAVNGPGPVVSTLGSTDPNANFSY